MSRRAISDLDADTSEDLVIVHTGNGLGAVNTTIRRFTTTLTSVGSGIVYADSANDGASFTIRKSGYYYIHFADRSSGASNPEMGITVNSAELTTAASLLTSNATKLAWHADINSNINGFSSAFVYLNAGDIVRPHCVGNENGNTLNTRFVIGRVPTFL